MYLSDRLYIKATPVSRWQRWVSFFYAYIIIQDCANTEQHSKNVHQHFPRQLGGPCGRRLCLSSSYLCLRQLIIVPLLVQRYGFYVVDIALFH